MKVFTHTYLQGRDKITSFLCRLLYEFLGLASAVILLIFFCEVNILLLLDELPPKITKYSL
jgi:hypothetical protein